MPQEQRKIARFLRSGRDSREFLVRLGFWIVEVLDIYHYVVAIPEGWTAVDRPDKILEIKDNNGVVRVRSYPTFNLEVAQLEIVHP